MATHAQLASGWAGDVGVDIFFVLSGFLITSLLIEEWDRFGSISLRRFYARRALRLLPALMVMLAVIVTRICSYVDAVNRGAVLLVVAGRPDIIASPLRFTRIASALGNARYVHIGS
jgi:hypothetical protein